jgi:hypothetical protein
LGLEVIGIVVILVVVPREGGRKGGMS